MVAKPNKPRPDFPLYAHASGQWAKRIRGKLHYFGAWSNPQAALVKYAKERDDLYAGRTPPGEHVCAIGSTWWDWESQQSIAVAFDFDATQGHAGGNSPEQLEEVLEAARTVHASLSTGRHDGAFG